MEPPAVGRVERTGTSGEGPEARNLNERNSSALSSCRDDVSPRFGLAEVPGDRGAEKGLYLASTGTAFFCLIVGPGGPSFTLARILPALRRLLVRPRIGKGDLEDLKALAANHANPSYPASFPPFSKDP